MERIRVRSLAAAVAAALIGVTLLADVASALVGNIERVAGTKLFTPQTLVADEPSFVPPSSLTMPLFYTADSLHYMIRVSVGTAGQTLNLILDTGSSDMILLNSSYCQGSSHYQIFGSLCYTPQLSSTYQRVADAEVNINLQIDGESVQSNSARLGTDIMRWAATDIGTLSTSSLTGTVQLVLAALGVTFSGGDRPLHQWPDSDGVLGAAYPIYAINGASPFVNMWQSNVDSSSPIFSVDFNAGESPSTLYLSGIYEPYRNLLQWGDQLTTSGPIGYHAFILYNLQLCGVDLFQDYGGEWNVIIDTGAAGLTAPAEFFDLIMSWLPVTCEVHDLPYPIGDGNQQACYLAANQRTALPTLNFKISSNGDWLRLPIEDLLLPATQSDPRRRIAMTRGISIYSTQFVPVWSFGSKTLRSLYTVFYMASPYQIAMANKPGHFAAPSNGSTLQCVQRRSCVGMQTHEPSLNVCVDPACNLYYFFLYDAEQKICVLDPGFFTAVVVVVTIFLFTEIFLHEATAYLSNRVYQNFAPPARVVQR